MFLKAIDIWQRCDSLRRNRQRFKQYTYGDQWSDIIDDGTGHMRREREVIKLTGSRPLTNNLIRRLVKTIVGRYRTLARDEHLYSTDPRSVDATNHLEELDARLLEEFLISGCAIQRISLGTTSIPGAPATKGVRVDNISPTRFFIDSLRDPRGWDVRTCGVLHDMPPADIVARFGGADPAKARRIREIYRRLTPDAQSLATGSGPGIGAPFDAHTCTTFLTPDDPSKCRVIEVWTLEDEERLLCLDPDEGSITAVAADAFDALADNNARRRKAGLRPCELACDRTSRWQCRWYAPDGSLLATEPSPIPSGQLPFAFKFYPLTDGEVHPFVEDLIGLQKYINRLITLIDRMIGSSAKGVLLFPMSQKPDNVSWEEISQSWTACNGILPITGNSTILPQQVNNGIPDNGASSLLALELKLFDEVSGVTGALLGSEATSAKGAGMYEAQVRNATMALADTFRTFASFTAMRNHLIHTLTD